MCIYSFDFIKDPETRNATKKVYDIIIQNNLLIWVSNYTPSCSDSNQQLVGDIAEKQGIDSILMAGSIMRVAIVAKYGYDELRKKWNNK
jgi:hypothetical protein